MDTVLLQTRIATREADDFDAIAAAHNVSRAELLRRAVAGVNAEWRERGRPCPAPAPPTNGAIPPAIAERGQMIKNVHELAMMREGVLLQLEADANEAEGTDPDTAALLRGVVAELRQARYSYDFGTRRWTLAVGELRQSVTAPGFDPNALTVVTSSMER